MKNGAMWRRFSFRLFEPKDFERKVQFLALSTSLFLEIPRAPAGRSPRTRKGKNVDFIQFLALSTSLFLEIHGIIARSLAPTSSIWWLSFMRRMPLKRDRPARYSC